jgi:hypothetical protein
MRAIAISMFLLQYLGCLSAWISKYLPLRATVSLDNLDLQGGSSSRGVPHIIKQG